ncbi:hypothetical protein E2C01_083650 [Portunus trituberculatus]|uniref:Uncharacterized protein n=1 Tax=Portunus trituberculatus TaxID=210409 RepID=A0A5B7IT08_PORTR|nr:hypothetical protein [Portunus trituberculatus]
MKNTRQNEKNNVLVDFKIGLVEVASWRAPSGARGRLKSLGNIMEVVRRRSFSLAQAASCSAIPDHPDIRDHKCVVL